MDSFLTLTDSGRLPLWTIYRSGIDSTEFDLMNLLEIKVMLGSPSIWLSILFTYAAISR